MYALYKVLAAGWRVTYDPRLFTYHLHRADSAALHRAIRGYGVGLIGGCHEAAGRGRRSQRPEGLVVARAPVRTCGRAAPARTWWTAPSCASAWDYLRGGLAGPGAPAAGPAGHRGAGAAGAPAAPASPRRLAPVPQPEPAAAAPDRCARRVGRRDHAPQARGSRALPRRRWPASARSTAALGGGARGLFRPTAAMRASMAPPPRPAAFGASPPAASAPPVPATPARSAAAAPLLLFLDDDLVPAPDLVRAPPGVPLARRTETRSSIGYSPPRPARDTLAAQAAALWWEGHFRRQARDGGAHVRGDAEREHVRAPPAVRAGGGASTMAFGRHRREDWEWGIRVLQAGARLRYAPDAVAEHRFELDGRGRIAAARRRGAGRRAARAALPVRAGAARVRAPNPLPRAFSGRLVSRLLIDEQRPRAGARAARPARAPQASATPGRAGSAWSSARPTSRASGRAADVAPARPGPVPR